MNWTELLALWAERDLRYRKRKVWKSHVALQMTPEEARAVRLNRRSEIALMPEASRQAAIVALNSWYPPIAR